MKRNGYCECDCGQLTAIVKKTDRPKGLVRGDYRRFLVNHDKRRPDPGYREENRGYSTPCWIWQGALLSNGYGVGVDQGTRRQTTAHRLYYERFKGPIARGLEPDHLCKVKACVNPAHLELVTRSENTARGRLGKLTLAEIEMIRLSGQTNLQLAQMFGVTRQHIGAIRAGRSRKG